MPWTIQAASEALRGGRLSPLTLLDTCLERIDRLESKVHAWVSVDREGARAEAKRAEEELRHGRWRGPLHGVPVGIKDVFDVFDWPTAAGSRLWTRSIARHDAPVVQRLRQAGAVFVGKTVTTQYASFDPSPTRNPWNLDRTPGGSSSGSAAAIALGMCLGALATQTGGSITRPASYCGAAGLKPTYGRISTTGVVPLAASMDHVGAIARSVRDLAVLFQVIADAMPSSVTPPPPVPDALPALARPLPAPRLGRLRGLFEERGEPSVRAMMDQVVALVQARGGRVDEVALPAGFAEVVARHRTVMAVEAASYHQVRLERHPEDYDRNIRGLLEEGLECPAPEYARCKEHQRQLSQAMLECFGDVDALLTPATVGPAPDRETTGDPAFNSPWSYTGLPTVSFPARLSPDGLPLAVQLVGRPWDEARLLAAAAWCEGIVAFEERPALLGGD
jgi:aspartyl-tRNA(Asn)/glutamyl-tRNA(Gln) amidotransferase subunit A